MKELTDEKLIKRYRLKEAHAAYLLGIMPKDLYRNTLLNFANLARLQLGKPLYSTNDLFNYWIDHASTFHAYSWDYVHTELIKLINNEQTEIR